MGQIVRFSVSVERELLERFEAYCERNKHATRSEAVRQLIHECLTRDASRDDQREVAATLTLVYDHHRPQLRDRLTDLQHDHTDLVVSVMHTHLSHEICLEVIVLRGPAGQLRELASGLGGMKGVMTSELVVAEATPKDS